MRQVFAGVCGGAVRRADRKNIDYLEQLRAMIAEDGIAGLHKGEYTLSVGTEPEQ
jgi:hypothetical protein